LPHRDSESQIHRNGADSGDAGIEPVEMSTCFTPFFGDLSLISRMAGSILPQIYEYEAGKFE